MNLHSELVQGARLLILPGLLSTNYRVHIPEVLPQLSSQRVLTMEFIDGVSVTDSAGLQRLAANPGKLSSLISETFNEMIFIHGDVHCDPHAANMLVRKVNGHTQLVLLDHGLYKQIDDKFRRNYAALWRALIFADHEGIKEHSKSMNAGADSRQVPGCSTDMQGFAIAVFC